MPNAKTPPQLHVTPRKLLLGAHPSKEERNLIEILLDCDLDPPRASRTLLTGAVVYKIPILLNDPKDETDNFPSKQEMQRDTWNTLYCRWCGLSQLNTQTPFTPFRMIKPMPSLFWEELQDLWFCHALGPPRKNPEDEDPHAEPHDHTNIEHSEHVHQGCGSSLRLSGLSADAQPQHCLVGDRYIGLHKDDIREGAILTLTSQHAHPQSNEKAEWVPVLCTSCGWSLGHINNTQVRLFKHSVTTKPKIKKTTNGETNEFELKDDEEEPRRCSACSKPQPKQVCGRCRFERYCDVNCQRSQWHIHKLLCVPPRAQGRAADSKGRPPPGCYPGPRGNLFHLYSLENWLAGEIITLVQAKFVYKFEIRQLEQQNQLSPDHAIFLQVINWDLQLKTNSFPFSKQVNKRKESAHEECVRGEMVPILQVVFGSVQSSTSVVHSQSLGQTSAPTILWLGAGELDAIQRVLRARAEVFPREVNRALAGPFHPLKLSFLKRLSTVT